MPIYLSVTIRAILAYLSLLLLTRLMGKRQISQMTYFDYIVGITIGTIAGSLVIDLSKNFYVYLSAIVVFTVFQILSSYFALKSKLFRRVVQGTKTVLIENGKVNEDNMRKARLNMDELEAKLRNKNVFKLQDVEMAYFEIDGQISVVKKASKQPITPSNINKSSK